MFQQYAHNAIASAQDRGCTNVFPIVKVATTVNHNNTASSLASTAKHNASPSSTKKRLGLTWEG